MSTIDLFGKVHTECSKGWGRRCPLATSKHCSCACGGANHGTHAGAPVKASKRAKAADISVLIVEDEALQEKIVREHFGKGITFAQIIRAKDRKKVVEAIEKLEL